MRLLAMILVGLFVSTHTPVEARLTRTVPRDVGWTQLSAPPGPLGDVRVWLGDRVLVWGRPSASAPGLTAGARRRVRADVLVFGRAARWLRASPGPLEARSLAVSAWTGSRVLIWGGFGGSGVPVASGAVYDPRADRWAMLPRSPLSARAPVASVWTGRELVVWGSTDRSEHRRDGAAYNPATRSWRRIADAPRSLDQGTSVWTGHEMLVLGAHLDDANNGDTKTAVALAYNPTSDTWRVLPRTDLVPQATTIAWTGRIAVAFDYTLTARAYDPQSNRWRPLPGLPIAPGECYPTSVPVSGQIVGWYCGRGAVFNPMTNRWTHLDPPAATAGLDEPVSTGTSALFPGGVDQSSQPELWAWRVANATPSRGSR